jgi:hypothetical protein
MCLGRLHMIRRIRALASTSPAELVEGLFSRLSSRAEEDCEGEQPDDALEVLVKNAMQPPDEAEGHASLVWRRLKKKVTGPFGMLAVEGPGVSLMEDELLNSGGTRRSAPFVLAADSQYGKAEDANSAAAMDALRAAILGSSGGATPLG